MSTDSEMEMEATVPLPMRAKPATSTATQNEEERQETEVVSFGSMLTREDQELPFQVSALPLSPTVTQKVEEGQETEVGEWLGSTNVGEPHVIGPVTTPAAADGNSSATTEIPVSTPVSMKTERAVVTSFLVLPK
ncbi:MAG: hypothetical protein M1420_02830 [Actinobacteria bacterium]|jgi:hypothetical protein|nr:hypothetical protein [Actinomycetota bacterium]